MVGLVGFSAVSLWLAAQLWVLAEKIAAAIGRRGFIASGETKVIDNAFIGIHVAARHRCSQLGLPTAAESDRALDSGFQTSHVRARWNVEAPSD